MDDLILKYFKEDLTEKEEQALEQMLLSAPEEAQRFGQMAERVYIQFGLPEPQWHGQPPHGPAGGSHPPTGPSAEGGSSSGSGGFLHASSSGGLFPHPWVLLTLKPLVWALTVLIVGGAGLIAWHYENFRKTFLPEVKPALPFSQPGSDFSKPRPVTGQKIKSREQESAKRVVPSTLAPRNPATETQTAAGPQLTQVSTPMPVSSQPHDSPSSLSILVRRDAPGDVAVRVLNSEGTPVVLLYEGLLQAGSWIFNWNGQLQDGRPVEPGYYQILVQSSSVTQVKNVLIH